MAAIHLGLPLPAGSCGLPAGSGEQPSNACAGPRLAAAAFLGLAPGGVYRATPVTRGAGGLLPHRFTLTGAAPRCGPAVCFSVALSRGSPRVAVNNHPALWSPDVPRRRRMRRRRDRPADSSVARHILRGPPGGPVDSLPPWISCTSSCWSRPGCAAGAVNAIAGGGSLITFPTLLGHRAAAGRRQRHQLGLGLSGLCLQRGGQPGRSGRAGAAAAGGPADERGRAPCAGACCCWSRRRGRLSSWCRSWCSGRRPRLPSRSGCAGWSGIRGPCRRGGRPSRLQVGGLRGRGLRRLLRCGARRHVCGRAGP